MRSYWSDTRANGTPVEAGTVCYVMDPEDGTNPIYTYGATQDEVMAKVSRTAMTAQSTLTQVRSQHTPPPPQRQPLSAERRQELVEDLQDPAKAGAAMNELMADHTGVDPMETIKQRFADLCQRWAANNPDFYPHPGNIRNVATRAVQLAGNKLGAVTDAVLTQAFEELDAKGELFDAPAEPSHSAATPPEPSNRTEEFPDRHQVQPIERPRGRFATTARPTFRTPQPAAPKTPKYSEADIRSMPERKRRELIESNDPEFAAACEALYA